MAEFKAKNIDLDLELTLLNGNEELLKPKIIMNTTNMISIVKQWRILEEQQKDARALDEKIRKEKIKKEKETGIKDEINEIDGEAIAEKEGSNLLLSFEVMAIELAMIYDKDKTWWLENLDFSTIGEILQHVAQTIGGLKKSTANSN